MSEFVSSKSNNIFLIIKYSSSSPVRSLAKDLNKQFPSGFAGIIFRHCLERNSCIVSFLVLDCCSGSGGNFELEADKAGS